MTALGQEGEGIVASEPPVLKLPKLRWTQILAISIFWFALNFHWSALGIIILPSQVFKMVGEAHKGAALASVLVPGAFVALFSNPLFGMLSDQMRGRLASWGRRRPYILIGTLVNVVALIGMAGSSSIPMLAAAYVLVQFSSNAAQAPFHALLPDLVPVEQRGMASGVMGLLLVMGSIFGVIVAGQLVDASMPLPQYEQRLWLIYGVISAVLVVLMLVTIIVARESKGASWQMAELRSKQAGGTVDGVQQQVSSHRFRRPGWLTNSFLRTVIVTIVAVGISWGLMTAWNSFHVVTIANDVQQVILEIVATIGLLRIFGFNPRRDPDFAWVLITRLLVMLGIYTIQDFLQYYMRDVIGVVHAEQQVTNFVIVVSITSLISSLIAGWLSDRFGRKRLVYISGCMMALVGLVFIFTHDLFVVITAGALFGLGYGAYLSVDWALVADVLPSARDYARDMGVWNIASSLPQIIAPVFGGPLLDFFRGTHQSSLGFQLLFACAILYCIGGTVTVRFIRGVKQ